MKSEIDLLSEVRPATPAPGDVVPPQERALLLNRIITTPDPAASHRRETRTPHRGVAVLRLAAPAAAVGAAAVLAITVAAPPRSTDGPVPPPAGAAPGPSAGTPAAPGGETVRYLVARAETALAATGGMVLVSTVRDFRGCDSRTVTLLDPAGRPVRNRWTETCGGNPSQDVGVELVADRPHSVLTTAVHHEDRTWSRAYVPAGDDPHDAFPHAASPERLRAELTRGELVIVGRERLEGRATIHLRASSPDWPRSMDPQYWIDASSYLLLRSRIVKGSPEDQTLLVTEHDWQRQTPERRAQLTVPIPPDYRRTA